MCDTPSCGRSVCPTSYLVIHTVLPINFLRGFLEFNHILASVCFFSWFDFLLFHMPHGGGGGGRSARCWGGGWGGGGGGAEYGQIAEILSTRSRLAVLSFCIELNTQCF